MIVGAHISRKKTLQDTIDVILNNGGNALQIFSGSPRSSTPRDPNDPKYSVSMNWEVPNRTPFSLVIHAPYIINPAMPWKNGRRDIDVQDTYWFKCIINELLIADKIGAMGVVIHVGKYTKQTPEQGLEIMEKFISAVLEKKCILGVSAMLILETAAGQGTELLTNIDDLSIFYNKIVGVGKGECIDDEDYRKHFGLCLDTCHVWSCGYGCLESYKTIQKNTNGGIVCIHLNGSATPQGSSKDRHAEMRSPDSSIPMQEIKDMLHIVDKKVVVIIETPDEDDLEGDIQFVRE